MSTIIIISEPEDVPAWYFNEVYSFCKAAYKKHEMVCIFTTEHYNADGDELTHCDLTLKARSPEWVKDYYKMLGGPLKFILPDIFLKKELYTYDVTTPKESVPHTDVTYRSKW